ncbi:MAG: iron dependent repressor, metal binding and dimerization domain protein [Archaeoglobaceae archaeon]
MNGKLKRIEDYLEAIYDIQTDEQRMVKTGELSERFEIKPSSTTEMLSKLSEMDYLEYKPYYGVYLTEKGEEIARKIKKYHHLFETFFKNFLQIEEDKASELSCELEHYVDDRIAEKICAIVASSCDLCEECPFEVYRLSEAKPGTYKVILSPSSAGKIGITNGATLEVNSDNSVRVDGEDFLVSPKVASKIVLEP